MSRGLDGDSYAALRIAVYVVVVVVVVGVVVVVVVGVIRQADHYRSSSNYYPRNVGAGQCRQEVVGSADQRVGVVGVWECSIVAEELFVPVHLQTPQPVG